jgi:hypothetical protein
MVSLAASALDAGWRRGPRRKRRPARTSDRLAAGFLVIDAVHREAAMQLVPRTAFVSISLSALGDPGADEVERGDFGGEHARERLAVALADHHDDLALAGLVPP